jgi:hypothetical protein
VCGLVDCLVFDGCEAAESALPSPAVVGPLDQNRRNAAELLTTARSVEGGGWFTAGGQTMRRLNSSSSSLRIWAEDAGGSRHDFIQEEDTAFWTWAAVEVLRHTGIRIEELTELSHHSLVQYVLPDSDAPPENIALLPTKSGKNSLVTSNVAASPWVTVAAHTEPVASTNTAASAAPFADRSGATTKTRRDPGQPGCTGC